jgi:UDP-N-acetylmuramoyl-L-alanyl-D-glutamate--2,6-diaminopimelate ligase
MRWSRPDWCWRPAGDRRSVFDALARLQPVRGRLERAAITRRARRSMSIMPIRPMRWKRRSPRCARTSPGRLIVVFGAGGDRDAGKRRRWAAWPRGRPGHRHRRQPARRGPGRDPRRHPGRARPGAKIGDRRAAIAAAIAEAGAGTSC